MACCFHLHIFIVLIFQGELGDAEESGVDVVVVLGGGFEIRNVALGDAPVFCFLLRDLRGDSEEIAERMC